MTTTLVLLSYNERENLAVLLGQIPRTAFEAVFAVDAGSTDGSLDLYKEHDIPLHVQTRRGRGNAFLLALQHVQTDAVIFFSTDGNEDPAGLLAMKESLEEGYDMVVAGRYLLSGSATDDSDDPLLLRKFFGVAGGWIIRFVWPTSVRDPINGLRGFQVRAMHAMRLDAEGHDIELQSTIRSAKLGMRVKEIPTRELRRISGERKASAGTLSLVLHLGRTLLREVIIGRRF